MRNFRTLEDFLHENLQDPEEARAFLKVILEEYENDNDTETFLRALRIVGEAQGGITSLAKRIHLDRDDFYDTLREHSHLKPAAINTVLRELGFSASMKSIKNHDHHVTH